jgi:hypothetical protein
LKIGTRGPTTLEDFHLHEKIFHFDMADRPFAVFSLHRQSIVWNEAIKIMLQQSLWPPAGNFAYGEGAGGN